MSATVRLLTSTDPFEFREVPPAEVPAGCIRVHWRDRGEFFADPGLLQTDPDAEPKRIGSVGKKD